MDNHYPSSLPPRKRTAPVLPGQAQGMDLRPRMNFSRLDINSLRRYQRVHKLLGVSPAATKDQLVAAVAKHFATQVVGDEVAIIAGFVRSVQKQHQSAYRK